MSDDFDVLVKLNHELASAETRGDRAWLENALAPALAFRRANKACVDRAAFLEAVKAGAERETTIESITLHGPDRAVVTCVVSMKTDPQSDERKRFHNIRLFVRGTDGGWKLLGWANDPI